MGGDKNSENGLAGYGYGKMELRPFWNFAGYHFSGIAVNQCLVDGRILCGFAGKASLQNIFKIEKRLAEEKTN